MKPPLDRIGWGRKGVGGGADADGDGGGAEAGEATTGRGAGDFGFFHELVIDGFAFVASGAAAVKQLAEGRLVVAAFVEAPLLIGAHETKGETGGEAEGVAVVFEEFGLLEAQGNGLLEVGELGCLRLCVGCHGDGVDTGEKCLL
ncbi:hypothetical protein N9897_00110 [bacterium]|nr:hypothetical protein [bacterium]